MAVAAEWLEKDYYRVLGVPETATDQEITRAYRRLARRLHPDAGGTAGDSERFGEVVAAYEVLHDPARRREYDEVRRFASARAGAGEAGWPHGRSVRVNRRRGPGRSGHPGSAWARTVPSQDLFGSPTGDVFVDGLDDVSTRSRRGSAGRPPRRGSDLEAELELSFEDAVRGATRSLQVGSRTVTARIPAGVADGQTIRLRGRGGPGADGGPPGDLLVRCRVTPHRFFGRSGRDLTVTVPVTFAEAALGADISVPTLDRPVTLRVPPGTPSGSTLRVRGRGVPSADRSGRGAGDLLVTVEVDVPRELDDRQRAAVEALAAAIPGSPRAHLGV